MVASDRAGDIAVESLDACLRKIIRYGATSGLYTRTAGDCGMQKREADGLHAACAFIVSTPPCRSSGLVGFGLLPGHVSVSPPAHPPIAPIRFCLAHRTLDRVAAGHIPLGSEE
jgi:hypothetical protein